MTEQALQQRILLALGRGAARLWRNNTGMLRDQQGRPVRFGLCRGSSDLIGYTTIEVTPDMVGQRLAVFTAVEVKTPTGRPTPEQAAFLDHIRQAGGRAGIARSIDDAMRITAGTLAQR